MADSDDIKWMERALELAERAAEAGEVPVGALVVLDGQIQGEGWNQVISTADPSAHAEMVALRAAAKTLGNYRLPGCELYVTLEPCTMCTGTLIHARISRLVFAASEPRAGVVESNGQLLDAPYLNHRVQWQGGVCAERSARLLQDFFRGRRGGRGEATSDKPQATNDKSK
jgi:tRNA(adenine34) deaminase